MNFSNAVGWDKDEKPIAPTGFTATLYADGFDNPRWLYQTPNVDVLVAECNGKHTLRGRPVYVLMLADGSLLITDDKSNQIWRVTYSKQ
ncbi:MAG: hypothetical protein NVSMB7_13830 [Chitinophagaceae bacterium]